MDLKSKTMIAPLMLLFVFIGISIPLVRFINLGFYRRNLQGRYNVTILLFVLSILLLFVIPERISLLLTGPLLSQLILGGGEKIYVKIAGEEIFEVNENSLDPAENPFGMTLFDSILTAIAIIAPGVVYFTFS